VGNVIKILLQIYCQIQLFNSEKNLKIGSYLLELWTEEQRSLFCHIIAIWVRFIMQVQKFGGPPQKKLGTKNMQNLGQFHTTSDFDREYLRNGTRCPKSENVLIESNSSRVPPKKSGELWSTNYRVMDVSLEPPKLNFSGDYISALMGCGPSNFNRHYRLTKAC